MEWQSSVHLNIIDIEKAFYSAYIYIKTLCGRSWGFMASHARSFAECKHCIAISHAVQSYMSGILTPWFAVKTGVKHGCMLSPLRFVGYEKTTRNQQTGIRWTLTSMLEDVDYADNHIWKPFERLIFYEYWSSYHQIKILNVKIICKAATKICKSRKETIINSSFCFMFNLNLTKRLYNGGGGREVVTQE